jgi:hypothetical protein
MGIVSHSIPYNKEMGNTAYPSLVSHLSCKCKECDSKEIEKRLGLIVQTLLTIVRAVILSVDWRSRGYNWA